MEYQPGDEILTLTDSPTTLQDCGIGPFLITQVHTNGTITITITMYSTYWGVYQWINIWRVKLYWH